MITISSKTFFSFVNSNQIINVSITIDSDKQLESIQNIESNAYFDIFDERYKKSYKEDLTDTIIKDCIMYNF